MNNNLIITIGRQFGSGGKAIAALVAERLGVPLYDDALLRQAAVESGFDETIFKQADERRGIFSFSSVLGGSIGREEVFKIQSETIRRIAGRESAVIVGRCANYVLRDRDNVLNVFVSAPLPVRVGRISDKRGIPAAEAEAVILDEDRKREKYYDFFTFGHWGAASEYDLCIDSSVLTYDQVAEFIVEVARKRSVATCGGDVAGCAGEPVQMGGERVSGQEER